LPPEANLGNSNRKITFIFIGLIFSSSILFFAALQNVRGEIAQPVSLADVPYAQSTTCVTCHPGRYETWHNTFHRTMTQRPSPTTIVGDFDHASYTYNGITSRFTEEDGRFFIETLAFDQIEKYEVVMSIGSRRFQQYVTRIGDRHFRLPLAWHIEEGRWIHLNGGFLDPDGTEFTHHTAIWDANCIFCHNVKAQPGYDFELQTFDADVAELGIACEACHGPASEHIGRNHNPLRRYLLYLDIHPETAWGDDPTLISPNELEPLRQVQLCGHCHGQRVPNPRERIEQLMTEGDPFTAGENLTNYTQPIFIDTELGEIDIAKRFWADGTPRLTAYEYQGYLLSQEHHESDLTCTSCHNMHGGDPAGMIDPVMRTNEGCLQCHQEIEADVAAHTKHTADGPGSDCYACHMPDITYGLLNIHPTHHIENPEPAKAWRYEMPEACTLCHTNQTAVWAAEAQANLFDTPLPDGIPTDLAFDTAESIRALFMGDAVQRAVAIHALSGERYYRQEPQARLWVVPFLLLALEDNYPAVRYFAWRGLREVTERAEMTLPVTDFDYLAEAEVRAAHILALWDWWATLDKTGWPFPGTAVPLTPDFMPQTDIIESLLARRSDEQINIGE
jgi:predicted CXXCH cytochrome family protein